MEVYFSMNANTRKVLCRLKNPTVILSIVSNLISLSLLLGYKLDYSLIMSAVTIICSIMVTLGIMTNPDKASEKAKDKIASEKKEQG